MHQKFKPRGKATAIPVGLAIGGVISLIITLVGSAATAYLVLNQQIGENSVGYASIVILLLGSSMGAWGAYTCIKRQRLQICLLSVAVYYLSLLAITALFFGGRYQGMGVTAIVIFIGGAIVALFPTKGKANFKFKKRAYR